MELKFGMDIYYPSKALNLTSIVPLFAIVPGHVLSCVDLVYGILSAFSSIYGVTHDGLTFSAVALH